VSVTDTIRQQWLEQLSSLNCSVSKDIAPHKPLLLLIVCDLAETGLLPTAILRKDGDLAFRFSSYWTVVAHRRSSKPELSLPFFHLKGDGAWIPFDEHGNVASHRDIACTAKIEPTFFDCLGDPAFRELARRTLISKYFQPSERAELFALVGMAVPPDDIIAADATRFLPSDREIRRRDTKFAFRVLPAYDCRCALTGYRMMAVNGSCPLDATHIKQFKRGGPCHPTNGIALSKTAHWLFDEGYWTIDPDLRVLVAHRVFEEEGDATLLLKRRAGTRIILPKNRHFLPAEEFLQWHRTHKFEKKKRLVPES
jgi:putative restriction endonuclease